MMIVPGLNAMLKEKVEVALILWVGVGVYIYHKGVSCSCEVLQAGLQCHLTS